jgi:hypothetical protein
MTHKNTYMPRKDAEFIAWAKTIYHDCHENAEEWEIPSEVILSIKSLPCRDALPCVPTKSLIVNLSH